MRKDHSLARTRRKQARKAPAPEKTVGKTSRRAAGRRVARRKQAVSESGGTPTNVGKPKVPPSPHPRKGAAPSYFAHPTAVVDEGAQIGDGTKIWHFCHVMSGARIGSECSLGQNVFVSSHGRIGNRCKLQNNVSVYDGVVLGHDVFVGPSAVFTNVINPRSAIARRDEYRPTIVENGASIGANATIVCGHVLGAHCFVAAGAVLTKDAPAHALMAGVPARRIGWMCRCGVTLPKTAPQSSSLKCAACGASYVLHRDDAGHELLELDPG